MKSAKKSEAINQNKQFDRRLKRYYNNLGVKTTKSKRGRLRPVEEKDDFKIVYTELIDY